MGIFSFKKRRIKKPGGLSPSHYFLVRPKQVVKYNRWQHRKRTLLLQLFAYTFITVVCVHFYYSCLRTFLLSCMRTLLLQLFAVHFYYSCMRTLLLQLFAYIFIKLMRTLLLQLYAYTFITTVCRTFLLQLFLRNNCQLNFCV